VLLVASKADKSADKNMDKMLDDVLADLSHTSGDKEFFVPSSDKKGQSRQTIFRQQPSWCSMIDTIVASKEFPFKTPSAFYRFATVHTIQYLHQCRGMPEKTQGLLCKLMAIDEVVRDEEIRRMTDESMASVSKYILERKKSGDITGAKELYGRINDLMSTIHNPREKRAFTERVEKQLGSLLENTGPVSFDPAHFGDEDRPEEEHE